MKYSIIALFLIFTACQLQEDTSPVVNQSETQINPKTPEEHIEEVRKHSSKGTCAGFVDEYMVDHIIHTKLPNPLFKKYISYKPWLTQLTTRGCNGPNALMIDTLENGDIYKVEIKTEDFDPSKSEIQLNEDGSILKINGSKIYGMSTLPPDSVQIKKLRIINIYLNEVPFNIPSFVYDQYYNTKLCTFILPQMIVEAYVDGDKLYIYLFGGKMGDVYMTKLIFDQRQYIGSIVSQYNDISCFGSFKGNPLWY